MGRKHLAILIVISATFGFLSLNSFVGVLQAQKTYELKASPENIHWGYFSADVEPVIRVNPGDIVIIEDVPRLLATAPIQSEKQFPEDLVRTFRVGIGKRGAPHRPQPHMREGWIPSTWKSGGSRRRRCPRATAASIAR